MYFVLNNLILFKKKSNYCYVKINRSLNLRVCLTLSHLHREKILDKQKIIIYFKSF